MTRCSPPPRIGRLSKLLKVQVLLRFLFQLFDTFKMRLPDDFEDVLLPLRGRVAVVVLFWDVEHELVALLRDRNLLDLAELDPPFDERALLLVRREGPSKEPFRSREG